MITYHSFYFRQYHKNGAGGALKSIVRALPVAILRPAAGAAEALSYTLLGLRNDIDPAKRSEEEDMWNVEHESASINRRPTIEKNIKNTIKGNKRNTKS